MRSRFLSLALVSSLAIVACGGDDNASDSGSTSRPSGASSTTTAVDVVPDERFPGERCAANRDAGTITFLTGFDLAASASVLDVVVAHDAGYFDELCLDVEIVASLSADNYAAVADGDAQFASGGSFSELVSFANIEGSDELVAATVEGRTAIDTLIVKAGDATEIADLDGSTIGVKGALPPAIDVMLRSEDLLVGEDFDTLMLEGLDPVRHLENEEISAIPGWKSNEVGVLERAGVGVALFDPLDAGVPGSFGLIFTSRTFVDEHPTAAQDFVRATMRGLADAVADPTTAAAVAVDLLVETGNPMGLSPEGEVFRWETEAALILDGTPEGLGLGVPDVQVLQAELDAYSETGYFGDSTPDATDHLASGLVDGLYADDASLLWPA